MRALTVSEFVCAFCLVVFSVLSRETASSRAQKARKCSWKSISYRLTGLVVLIGLGLDASAEPTPSFIAGYDRFGLHAEISPELSQTLLLTELNCTACHQSQAENLRPKGGPDLSGAGISFSRAWLQDLLINPGEAKPGTTMPDVLHDDPPAEKQKIVNALVAFLSTQTRSFPDLKATGLIPVTHEFWLKGNIASGEELYHSIGCVACHAPDQGFAGNGPQDTAIDRLLAQLDPEEIKELGLSGAVRLVNPVPHGDLTKKYSLFSLTHFLHDPERTRPAGRMPNLKLLPSEAADLAAYLLRNQTQIEATNDVDPVLIQAGRTYFSQMGCVNCHPLQGITSSLKAPALAALAFDSMTSCVVQPSPSQPTYALSQNQVAILKQIQLALISSPVEADSDLRMLQLNCYACHERNTLGGVGRGRQQYFETVGHVDLGDEGRLPPSLTHIGKKLTPTWFAKVLAGTGDIRPHMTARMPIFPKAHVKDFPQQLAAQDRASGAKEFDVFGDLKDLAKPGRELLNTGCIQCHPLNGESLASVVGTDLAGVHERIRPAWFKEFLRNPGELKNRTRMPTFFPNGVSTNQGILEGDVDRQIAAIWTYLKESTQYPLPEKILEARSKNFELIPTDKPLVLRSFMDRAGTHAIAVGFPEKINIAFDAEKCQLVEAWKGRFLDAHGTWYDRFTPLAEPLGTDRVPISTRWTVGEATFTPLDKAEQWTLREASQPRFLGYRLNRTGIPIFRYQLGERQIEDWVVPAEGGLLRKISVAQTSRQKTSDSSFLGIQLLQGDSIQQINERTFRDQNGLTVTLADQSQLKPGLVKQKQGAVVFASLQGVGHIEFEVHYKW